MHEHYNNTLPLWQGFWVLALVSSAHAIPSLAPCNIQIAVKATQISKSRQSKKDHHNFSDSKEKREKGNEAVTVWK